MALITDYTNSQDTNFQYKIRMALISTALAVQAEAASAASHAARSAYALLVLANPQGYAQLMASAFTVDGALDPATATDAQIETRASAIWNAYAVQG
jgi:hypothetical protein